MFFEDKASRLDAGQRSSGGAVKSRKSGQAVDWIRRLQGGHWGHKGRGSAA